MSSNNHKRPKITKMDEDGMASILVTLIMSVVITLIVLGFSQVATREQSNSLQNQLSTTAYYAAETGVNDAINIIQKNSQTNPNYPASYYAKNACGAPPTATPAPNNGALYSPLYTGSTTFVGNNSLSGAIYSCLLVNPSPSEIATTVSSNPQVIPINTGVPVASINITWNSNQQWNGSDCNASADREFAPNDNSNWRCELSVLRVDFVTVASGGFSEASLLSNSNSAFILPFNSSDSSCNGNVSFGGSCNSIYGATCSASTGCSINIATPNTSRSSSTVYYMLVSSIYGSSDTWRAKAMPPGSNSPLPLNNAEYIIDSTGVSHGVSKRIQVAVPILQSTNIPGYAIQTSSGLCKRFYIIPPGSPNALGDTLGVPQSAVTDFGLSSSGDCSSGY